MVFCLLALREYFRVDILLLSDKLVRVLFRLSGSRCFVRLYNKIIPAWSTYFLLCCYLFLHRIYFLAQLTRVIIHWLMTSINKRVIELLWKINLLFTQSVYIWMTSSTSSTDKPRFRWESRISSAFPPLLSMKCSTSNVIAGCVYGVRGDEGTLGW